MFSLALVINKKVSRWKSNFARNSNNRWTNKKTGMEFKKEKSKILKLFFFSWKVAWSRSRILTFFLGRKCVFFLYILKSFFDKFPPQIHFNEPFRSSR